MHPTDVLVGTFDLSALGSGLYILHMEILDQADELKVEQTRKFSVLNPAADSWGLSVWAMDTFGPGGYATMAEDKREQGEIQIRHVEDLAVLWMFDEPPELIGGLRALQGKVRYPKVARRAGIQGRVIVHFTVDEKGNVRDAIIHENIGGGLDEEVIRVTREHAKFKPGIYQGKRVSIRMALLIIFRLGRGLGYLDFPALFRSF